MAQTTIQLDHNRPNYWQVNGKACLLLGGSREDNLFQTHGQQLIEHLDTMQDIGANYVRCTMSARDPGDVQPHLPLGNGRYELTQWNPAYWERFQIFLEETDKRGIIAQIELWDRFDFSREFWKQNSFHPDLHNNYSAEQIGMETEYPEHPLHNKQPFFFSVPELHNNTRLLNYQHAFIDKVLQHSLAYDHLLYCMDNETTADPAWGKYWSQYIRQQASKIGKTIYCTEMWDDHDIRSDMHRRTIDDLESYQFLDLSQNTHALGHDHWEHLQSVRTELDPVRPINNVKIYGGEAKIHKDSQHAQECFWRGIFGGQASARFHRPPTGLGLSPLAQNHIKSIRIVQNHFDDFFSGKPELDRISHQVGGAYCFANSGDCIAIVALVGGPISCDCNDMPAQLLIQSYDIVNAEIVDEQNVQNPKTLTLNAHKNFTAFIIRGA